MKPVRVNAFVKNGRGGNPAGVVLLDAPLEDAAKLAIAKEMALSETAFVSLVGLRNLRMEFWTPEKRVLDCGHATLAALEVWKNLKSLEPGLWTKTLVDGSTRRLQVDEDGSFWSAQPRARFSRTDRSTLVGDQGVRFELIEVESPSALQNFRADQAEIFERSKVLDLVGQYVFARTPQSQTVATARMFAPYYGIPEESATGMAAGILGSLLSHEGHTGEFEIEQGAYMARPSPSLIRVRPEKDQIWVGGRAQIC